jgi:type III restriction enzyme
MDIDVNKEGRIVPEQPPKVFVADLQAQLRLLAPRDTTTPAELAVWLDRHIPHPDITQTQAQLFLMRLVESLTNERGLTIEQLSADRLRLRDAAEKKIEKYRRAVVVRAFNWQLFGEGAQEIEVSPQCVFTFDPNGYAPNRFYEGNYPFRKHYYRAIGAMNDEEVRCAEIIDAMPNVKYWVRNIERAPKSYWLQTSSDKFYPDFVALLNDGRAWVVEYKGERDYTPDMITPDADEKRKLGQLWAARSNAKCVFALVGAHDYEARLRAVAA